MAAQKAAMQKMNAQVSTSRWSEDRPWSSTHSSRPSRYAPRSTPRLMARGSSVLSQENVVVLSMPAATAAQALKASSATASSMATT